MKQITLWLRAMRIPFLQASVLPVVVGSALAYRNGAFSWELFWIMAAGMGTINIGTNLTNDYFDHESGADGRNSHPTPFSGGSRVIQEGLIKPDSIFIAAAMAYTVAVMLGLYLVIHRGLGLLWFGVPGVVLSFFYTAPPLMLGYRGWGEPLVGLLLGPLAVLATYYVFMGGISGAAIWISLPVGFLVMAILYINEFPDAEPDAAAGKNHWIARLGRERAVGGYFTLLTAAYFSILLPVLLGILPIWTLLALLSLPLAVRAAWILKRSYNQIQDLVPAMALTIQLHLSIGLLLSAGLLLDHWTGR
jgi:1,4-dihydroxy-2-naphthoate octaprenyltransferase